jgi:hypothetical protein
VTYRALRDDPGANTANYYGAAEKYWGLIGADGTWKGALQAWAEGVRAARAMPDTTPPSITIQEPRDGAAVHDVVRVAAAASDASGVRFVAMKVDQGAWRHDDAAPHAWSWDSHRTADGLHTLTVLAEDNAGNRLTRSIHVRVDNTPPAIRITPRDNPWVRGTVQVAATVTDASTVPLAAMRVDQGTWQHRDEPPRTWSWDTAQAGDGSHALAVTAMDGVGNWATQSAQVRVDNTPPTVSIITPQPGSVYAEGWTVTGDSDTTVLAGDVPVETLTRDAGAGMQGVAILVDGATRATLPGGDTTWLWHAGQEALGEHLLRIVASDRLGNQRVVDLHVTIVPTEPEGAVATLNAL